MTQKTIKLFINEIYSKPLKRNYPTNKTDVYHNDDIWSLDILNLKVYGPENNRGYRYVLVIIDNFSIFGWTIPLKKSSNNKRLFRKKYYKFKKHTNSIGTDRGKEIYNNVFQNSLNKNNIQLHSGNSSLGSVFAERFNRSIKDLLKKPVFEKGDGNWIKVLPTIRKQYNNRGHSTTNLTPIKASLQKNEGVVYNKLLDK